MTFLDLNSILTTIAIYTVILMLISLFLLKSNLIKLNYVPKSGLTNIREDHLRSLIENATDAFFIHDFQGNILDVNKAAYERLGYSRDEILSMSVFDVEIGANAQELIETVWPSLINGNSYLVHGKHKCKDGTSLPVDVNITCLKNNNKNIIFALAHDTTESEAIKDSLQKLALTDELTNLPNRRAFMASMDKEFTRTQRKNGEMSILMIDIDHFKNINDTYGHACGDSALIAFTKEVNKSIRSEEIIARVGGEEFCVLLADTHIDNALFVAEKLRAIVEKIDLEANGKTIHFTISIGVATFSNKLMTAHEILTNADKALYCAKTNGRNRVEKYHIPTKKQLRQLLL